jgi:alanine racemase
MSRPVWAEIDLDRLGHNMREVRKVVGKEKLVTAVIKADGYGHGARIIAQTLLDHGADRFAVATFSEALELKKYYPEVPTMVLGYTREEDFELAEKKGIILTIFNYEQAKRISDYHRSLKVHVKINSGMNRLGFRSDDDALEKTLNLFSLDIEGMYSHLAMADESDKTFTSKQVEIFKRALETAKKVGREIPIRHIANSAGIIDHPENQYDMVRAGIMLYGLYPSVDVDHEVVKLKQVMSLKARVAMVQTIEAGEGVSYGQIYQTDSKRKIATLPLGYADGFTRMLTGKAEVAFEGQRRRIIGRICMDQCMMDANELEIERDDIVEIFGDEITIDEVASRLGTINYEIVCMISKRIPRVYIQNGQMVRTLDYITENL